VFGIEEGRQDANLLISFLPPETEILSALGLADSVMGCAARRRRRNERQRFSVHQELLAPAVTRVRREGFSKIIARDLPFV